MNLGASLIAHPGRLWAKKKPSKDENMSWSKWGIGVISKQERSCRWLTWRRGQNQYKPFLHPSKCMPGVAVAPWDMVSGHAVAKGAERSVWCSPSSHPRAATHGRGKQRWLSWLHIVRERSVAQTCLRGATLELTGLWSVRAPLLSFRPWPGPRGTALCCVEVPLRGGCTPAWRSWSKIANHALACAFGLTVAFGLPFSVSCSVKRNSRFPLLLCCTSWGSADNLAEKTGKGGRGKKSHVLIIV